MKNLIYLSTLLLLSISCKKEKEYIAEYNIIPQVNSIEFVEGNTAIDDQTYVYGTEKAINAIDLAKSVLGLSSVSQISKNSIEFVEDLNLEPEEYSLEINNGKIIIKSSDNRGYIWAVRTLQQMLPADFNPLMKGETVIFRNLKINDKPLFKWRGSLMDVCRHFMPVEKVKEYIDLLSFHKMNVLHWHLTEDQGWRIEIKKYPLLTEVGAWRNDGEGGKYGGFYSQEQIKDVVEYASKLGVEIVPEIEFPGHSMATLSAYPHLSCTNGHFEVQTNWGVFEDILCAGNDDVFTFAEDVLSEVSELFPSKYIHIGGDEAPKIRWENCPKCQNRIKTENLENEHHLQSYFISRLEKILKSKGKKLIGWDEIMEGGLAPEATMQVWRDESFGIEAIKLGHDIISSPTSHCYLDYSQKQISVEKIYSFNPIPAGISADQAKRVLGSEGNLWSERITPERLYYMAFPRITALSEVLWTNQKDYSDFYQRLQKIYPKYDRMGVNYGPEGEVMSVVSSTDKNSNFIVKINPASDGLNFKYAFDSLNFENYTDSIVFKKSSKLSIQAFKNERRYGEELQLNFADHRGRNSKYTIINPPSGNYQGSENALNDGVLGSENYRDGNWKGFNGSDLEILVDFETENSIEKITLCTLSNVSSWIFCPKQIEVYSIEGEKIELIANHNNNEDPQFAKDQKVRFELNINKNLKKFKIVAKNYGDIPQWHNAKGNKSWLFVDEVIIE